MLEDIAREEEGEGEEENWVAAVSMGEGVRGIGEGL